MVSGHLGNVKKTPEYETIALHGAQEPDPVNGSRALPLYQTTSYNFTDAADGAAKFAWSKEGYVYTRVCFRPRFVVVDACKVILGRSGLSRQMRDSSSNANWRG